MDFFIALVVFLCGIFLCMIQGWSLVPGLAFGMVCFAAVARYRGHRVREIISMAAGGARTALVVVRILLLIGCLTALWRASGTIAFFMHAGLTMIDSNIFLLMAFLLSALLSLTFGSAFGTAGTVGVILMAMARTGGADPAMTAGAVLSGAYFGERVSPASASAALTAALTGVDQNQFQRSMWRSTPVPLLLSLAFYGVLSYWFPIQQVEPDILTALEESFRLSWPTVLPAVLLLLLPFFHVKAVWAILASCILSAVLAIAVQGVSWGSLLSGCLFGWEMNHPELSRILSGGGVVSMVNSMGIVLFSCASSGILNGARMLEPVKKKLEQLVERTNLFLMAIFTAIAAAALLCNQSIALVLTQQMLEDSFLRRGYDRGDLARTLGNTGLILPALIPWSIAASVPLETMEASPAAIFFAAFVYLCPLWEWWSRRRSVQKI